MELEKALPYVEANGHKFGKVTPRDRARLLKAKRAVDRANLVDALKGGGITGEAYMKEVEAFDKEPLTDRDWILFVNSIDGKDAIIGLACRKLTETDSAADTILDALAINDADSLALVCGICGLAVVSRSTDPTNATEAVPDEPRPSEPAPSNPLTT